METSGHTRMSGTSWTLTWAIYLQHRQAQVQTNCHYHRYSKKMEVGTVWSSLTCTGWWVGIPLSLWVAGDDWVSSNQLVTIVACDYRDCSCCILPICLLPVAQWAILHRDVWTYLHTCNTIIILTSTLATWSGNESLVIWQWRYIWEMGKSSYLRYNKGQIQTNCHWAGKKWLHFPKGSLHFYRKTAQWLPGHWRMCLWWHWQEETDDCMELWKERK